MLIRDESILDLESVRAVHRSAFGRESEADLVDNLRSDGAVVASLVAIEAECVVGHILFTRLEVQIDGRPVKSAALAPLGVQREWQRQGVGLKLATAGLARLSELGIEAVFVLGHPEYYSRFGFTPGPTRNVASPFRGNPAFMALELKPGSLAGESGQVQYAKAFGLA